MTVTVRNKWDFNRIEEVGNRYGKLLVVKDAGKKWGGVLWECKCDCGNVVYVTGENLRHRGVTNCGCSRNYYKKTEIGKKYGKLLVIRDVGRKRGEILWECKCDCGNIVNVIGSNLRKGSTRSCGCLKYDYYKSVKGVKKTPDGYSSTTNLLNVYRRNAKKRGFEFSLSREQFVQVCKSRCYYCGCEPYQKWHEEKCNDEFIYNGLDRLNNDLGYTIDNVVASCGVCNFMKSAHSLDFFKDRIKKIYKNLYEKDIEV